MQALDQRFSNRKHPCCWKTLYVRNLFSWFIYEIIRLVGINFGYSYKVLNLHFLRILSMKNALIGDEFLLKLINICPALESLSLMCYLSVKISKILHNKLNYILVKCNRNLEKIKIDLPNLQRFF